MQFVMVCGEKGGAVGRGGRFPPQNVETHTEGAQMTLSGRPEDAQRRSEDAQGACKGAQNRFR